MDRPWEAVRGIGKSFGYNADEDASLSLSGPDLVRYLVDVVAKNGNLLINIGPEADGTIPEVQRRSLEYMGRWLAQYGQAIYATRPGGQELLTGVTLRVRPRSQSQKMLSICSKKPDAKL